MTALEKLLPAVGGEPQDLIIHPQLPGNLPLAAVRKSNWWGWIRPGADIRYVLNGFCLRHKAAVGIYQIIASLFSLIY
jgi:hypothetical protein